MPGNRVDGSLVYTSEHPSPRPEIPMGIWAGFIELLQAGLFFLTHVSGGNLAVGIVALTLTLRLALFPLTYSLARRSHARSLRLIEELTT